MKAHCMHSCLLLWCLVFVHLTQSNAESNFAATESIDHRLDGMEAAAEAALAERTASATKYKELVSEINELIQEAKRMQDVEKELVRRTYAVENLVKQANAVQLRYLASELNLKIEQEVEERRKLNRENAGGEQVDTSNAVTLEQLEQQTQLIPMMKDSETQLEEWILQVMDEEIALYHAKVAEMCSSGKCVTPIEAAQLVQASLTTFAHDGVNMVDHAQGAKIVYELTSDTYIPPTDESHERLGSVWWRRYIPQDWERVLPSQWEEWKTSIPSFLWHSFGQSSAETVPPEAILTANTLPGSCWAMNGSKGQVTIRLSYPVHVKAVTVDHTSALLADVQSAPRTMRIIAYPPCNNSDCNDGMGFDTTKAWDLTTIDYSIEEGETIQTFEISAPAASCAQEAPSCEANPDPLGSMYVSPQKDSFAAAITVAIENNWGKNDYTCLYRFRIHGDAAPEAT